MRDRFGIELPAVVLRSKASGHHVLAEPRRRPNFYNPLYEIVF
jgi:hypothetical protein